MKKALLTLGCVASFCPFGASADAAVLTYNFTGSLASTLFGFDAPETISGSLTYDTNADYESGGTGDYYTVYGPPLSINFVTSGGSANFQSSGDASGATYIHDDVANSTLVPSTLDDVQFISFSATGSVNGDAVSNIYAEFDDPSGKALSSDTTPPSLSDSAYSNRVVGFNLLGPLDSNGFPQIYPVQYSINVSAVPETATWAMMIIGVGAIGGMMRRAYRKSEDKFTAKVRTIAAA